MTDRTLTLKYAARCRRCGEGLGAGALARWEPGTGRTTCVRCPPSGSRGRGSQIAHADAPGSSRDWWQRLVDYHLGAVRLMSAPAPPKVTDTGERKLLHLSREELITGRGDVLTLAPDARAFVDGTKPQEVVLYGWPLAVVRDRAGTARVAPMFLTELAPGAQDGTCVPHDDEPFVNPALLSDAYADREQIAAAQEALADGIGFGDAGSVAAAARRVAGALGLDVHDVDPDRLSIPSAPPRLGVHNVAALVRGPSALTTRALVQELAELRRRTDWVGTAAGLLGRSVDDPLLEEPTSAAGAVPPVMFEGLGLNDSQEEAVAAALARDVSVVTGPPGTGKSQLVASIVANQWLAGRSVLVASTNNGAVDVAVERCARLDPALLLRTGNQEVRDRLPPQLEEIASRALVRGPSARVIHGQLEAAARGRREVHDALESRARDEAALAQLLVDVEVLRARLWGQAAAHSSRADAEEVGRLAARALRHRFLRRRRARQALTAAAPTMPGVSVTDIAEWATTEQHVARLTAALRTAGTADPVHDRDALTTVDDAWAAAGTQALRDTVQQRLHAGRTALQHLARIRPGGTGRSRALTNALPTALGWACTALSAKQTFPLTRNLFDLLVVDEASQCSIAHLLPLAYRARRIVVVGDPNQLTPVVTLDRRADARLADAAGWSLDELQREALSVGNDSVYTAYAARLRTPPLLLSEHYRCHPAIARYVNEEFYGGMLRVLTDVTGHGPGVRGVVLADTPGSVHRGGGGGAHNPAEADAVVRWILDHPDEAGSIGVVTPFAAQVAEVRGRLRRALGTEAAARIRVGTAHQFQGDECDVILFSTVVTGDAGPGTIRWVEEQRNLVNVAVSRARRALVVITDVAGIRSIAVPTLQALVDMAGSAAGVTAGEGLLRGERNLHSEAERRVFAALTGAGLHPRLKEVVEGYELDLAVDTPAGPLDIEVDGAHHTDVRGRRRRQDLARDAVLESLGWRVMRVPAWRALAEPELMAREVKALCTPQPL